MDDSETLGYSLSYVRDWQMLVFSCNLVCVRTTWVAYLPLKTRIDMGSSIVIAPCQADLPDWTHVVIIEPEHNTSHHMFTSKDLNYQWEVYFPESEHV